VLVFPVLSNTIIISIYKNEMPLGCGTRDARSNFCTGHLMFLCDFNRVLFPELQERSVKFSSIKFHVNIFGSFERRTICQAHFTSFRCENFEYKLLGEHSDSS
jgi:hypothetical protein